MSRSPNDLVRKIKDVVHHVKTLPAEAGTPLAHYRKTGADLWNSILEVERAFAQPGFYIEAADHHLSRINGMVLINLIENFERFLKETASICVDSLASHILDDRLNEFPINASNLASHFATATLGKSLCESGTWLNCDEINKRFRKLLQDPFHQSGNDFHLFPRGKQQPVDQNWHFDIMALIWQIRHSIVHNVGVITQSDAVKLRLLAREPVEAPMLLAPTRDDLLNVKFFLDEIADLCNRRVGDRLAQLLTDLLNDTPGLFDPRSEANRLTAAFGFVLSVNGIPGELPEDSAS